LLSGTERQTEAPQSEPQLAEIVLERVSLRFRNVSNRAPSLKQTIVNRLQGKNYEVDDSPFWLYRDLDLHINHGERVGIIGPNGAGKSTLLKMICGVYRPTAGVIRVRGRLTPLLEMGAGFITELSGEENVVLSGAIQGYSRREILDRVDRIMEFAGLERFRDTPIKYYSSGMMSRLAFATATDLNPEILLVDEVLSAGDAEFVAKAQARMKGLMDAAHILLIVSHQTQIIQDLCQRVVWVDGGRVVADGHPPKIIASFHLHYAKPPEQRARDLDSTAAMLAQDAALPASGETPSPTTAG